jgi:hypothetical protein
VRGAMAPRAPRLWAGWALPADETPAGAFEAQVRAHEAEAEQLLAKVPPPPLRTNRTRRVPHAVLIGHAASLTPY